MDMEKGNKKEQRSFSRRKFLTRTGAGVAGTIALVYFGRSFIRRGVSEFIAEMDMPSGISDFEHQLWFEINGDNTITLKSPKVEMGQGIFTGYAMLAAEELDVDMDKINVEHASSSNGVISRTGVSNSTSSLYVHIREIAATLRETLKLEAAKLWSVDPVSISTDKGMLSIADKEISYAELVERTKEWEVAETPVLRSVNSFKYVGTQQRRVDLKDKILGRTTYGIDTHLPNMVYGAVLYSPFIGGELSSSSITEAEYAKEVIRVVKDKNWIGVVAKTRYAAEAAVGKIKATWDHDSNYSTTNAIEDVTVGVGTEVTIQEEGNPNGIAQGEIKSEYRTPIGFHANMEPCIMVADVVGDKVTIHTSYQNNQFLQQSIADALNFKTENVVIVPTFLGGGFGRRTFKHNAVEAARLSQAVGRPVHLIHNRQQEFQNGFVRPNTHHVLKGKLNYKNNTIKSLEYELATGPMGFMAMPEIIHPILGADFIVAGHGARISYSIENIKATIWQSKLPFETCMWRGVGMFSNTFAIESFMDELAHKVDADPLKFRITHCGNTAQLKRRKNLLELLGERSNWYGSIADNVGRGIAVCDDHKTIAAGVVELKIEEGQIKILKVFQAIDPGKIINPSGVKQQIEGATMMAISASLFEEGTIEKGQFVQTNFHNYQMVRLMDTPEIDVLMHEGSKKPSGVAEPPVSPIAPAIANAIFNLIGIRLRSLPLQAALDKNYDIIN